MNEIIKKRTIASETILIEVNNPLIARKIKPGQFVMLRICEGGERIPLTISDFNRDKGTITLIFHEIGKTTKLLGALNEGDKILDLAGPLGKESDIEKLDRVVVVGGGLGTALIFSQVKEMHLNGTKVDVLIGARNKDLIILEEEIRSYCDNLYIATDDGSEGHKGCASEILIKLLEEGHKYDKAIVVGPLIMMKVTSEITKQYGLSTIVSMNPIMIDGTGMCGGCRLTVGGVTRFACVDGPEFDGHEVDFGEAMRRQGIYRAEEKLSLEQHVCRLGGR